MHKITALNPRCRLGFCKIRLAGPCSDMITTPTPLKEWTQVDFCIHFFNYSPNSLPVSCRFVFLLLSTGSAPSAVFCALNSPELADKNNNILQRVCYHSHSISRGHGELLPHGGGMLVHRTFPLPPPNQTRLHQHFIGTHIYCTEEVNTDIYHTKPMKAVSQDHQITSVKSFL